LRLPAFDMRNFLGVFTNKLVNFLVNFREYIFKIALIRSIFQPKMHQMAFGGWAAPGPAGELTALPRPPSWIKGSLFLRKGDGKEVEEGEYRGWEGRRWEGEEMGKGGKERKERGM